MTVRRILVLRENILLLRDDILTSAFSRATCRPAQLLQEDISTYPVARGRHFDLFCCSLILLLRDNTSIDLSSCSGNISTYPAAPDDILLLTDDISTSLAAPGRTYIKYIILIEIVFETVDFTCMPDEHTSCQLNYVITYT